jgi:hypothetical protein
MAIVALIVVVDYNLLWQSRSGVDRMYTRLKKRSFASVGNERFVPILANIA